MRTALIILATSFSIGLNTSDKSSRVGQEDIWPLMRISAAHTAASLFNPVRVDADKIVVKDTWIQEGPPSQKITAAYMVIENHNSEEIALLSASTDAARVVELHKMEMEDGMMRMRRVDSISIPAGGTVALEPGGYHLMVISLNKELREGDVAKVTLRFSSAIQKTLAVAIKNRSSM